jgi:hypothetical protein
MLRAKHDENFDFHSRVKSNKDDQRQKQYLNGNESIIFTTFFKFIVY